MIHLIFPGNRRTVFLYVQPNQQAEDADEAESFIQTLALQEVGEPAGALAVPGKLHCSCVGAALSLSPFISMPQQAQSTLPIREGEGLLGQQRLLPLVPLLSPVSCIALVLVQPCH